MITIKDVARKCGYSVCTISRALSGKEYLKEETRQKILETVAELGYRLNTLAVNLKTGHRQTLALVLPSLTNIYYTKLEQYLEAYAVERGYIIYLNNTEYSLEKERQILENSIGMNIAGVIITSVASQYDHIMNPARYDIPYAYLSHSFEDDIEHCLRLNSKETAYEAVSYMVKLGHKSIDDIFQSFDNLVYRSRHDGMAQALKGRGLDCRPSHILFDIDPEDMRTTPGRVLQLLQKPNHPEAILARNDMTAFNVCRAYYILGLRILGHLSIFGYDDCIVANFVTPPLSTANIPVHKLAGTAVDFIHGYLEPRVRAELPILKVPLVIRNSIRSLNLD